jgi:hypothetical protein
MDDATLETLASQAGAANAPKITNKGIERPVAITSALASG